MAIIAFAVVLCVSAQPLTKEELSANGKSLAGVSAQSSGQPCGVSGFRDGDLIYVAGVYIDENARELTLIVAVTDAKTGKRLDAWSGLTGPIGKDPLRACQQRLDFVNISPTRAAALLHADDGDTLFVFQNGTLNQEASWSTTGKDKQLFRVRKGIANGVFDLELKTGKRVDVLRWNGESYGSVVAGNAYITSARASSELPHQGDFTYSAVESVDGAPETAWAEATKGTGVGETLELTLDDSYPLEKLELIPGCGFTDELWLKNERIKKLKITFDDQSEQIAELADTRKASEWKTISLTHDKPVASLKLEILDVYPGGAWKDGCISEVAVEPKPLPATGELDKATTFLGATCKTDWPAFAALWKISGDHYDALRELEKRLGKTDLVRVYTDDEKRIDMFSLSRCEDIAAVAGSLPKGDLALRLCAMKFAEVRRAFGDPPEKIQAGLLDYPWGGGKLRVFTSDRVHHVVLICPAP